MYSLTNALTRKDLFRNIENEIILEVFNPKATIWRHMKKNIGDLVITKNKSGKTTTTV